VDVAVHQAQPGLGRDRAARVDVDGHRASSLNRA
jgi:hypothetical protein